MILLDRTEKFFFEDVEEAEMFIEERKQNEQGMLIDYKLSVKETKSSTYYLVTVKTRFVTLAEAREA